MDRFLVQSIESPKRNEIGRGIISECLKFRRHEFILEQRQGHERKISRIMKQRIEQVVCRRHHVVAEVALADGEVLEMGVAVREKVVEQNLAEHLGQFDAAPCESPSANANRPS